MSWIKHVPVEEAEGTLAVLYGRIAGPSGRPDNILTIHGLRPHTLAGHMALYKAVLHHGANTLSSLLLETLAVWVSLLNGCDYCVQHHLAGLNRVVGDEEQTTGMLAALQSKNLASAFDSKTIAALRYAEKLTRAPASMAQVDVERLRVQGFDDGEILELNQVTSYFAYANRTVLGLGVELGDEALGLSPETSEDPDDWRHQ